MSQPRLSQSFTDGEVNVLHAMLQAALTGSFKNPESTATFQHTAQKVLILSKRFKVKT